MVRHPDAAPYKTKPLVEIQGAMLSLGFGKRQEAGSLFCYKCPNSLHAAKSG